MSIKCLLQKTAFLLAVTAGFALSFTQAPSLAAGASGDSSSHTIEEVIAKAEQYRTAGISTTTDMLAEAPQLEPPYSFGKLTPQLSQSALNSLKFFRYLAQASGEVTLNSQMAYEAQKHTVYKAIFGNAERWGLTVAPEAEDWHELSPVEDWTIDSPVYSTSTITEFYPAATFSSCTNLAYCDFFKENIDDYFRPGDIRVGFGYAMTKTATYGETAFRQMTYSSDYDYISWPSAGAFPRSALSYSKRWVIRLNTDIYKPVSKGDPVSVKVTRINDGKIWILNAQTPRTEKNGTPFELFYNNIYFKPDIDLITDADRFSVEVSGLKDNDEAPASLRYETSFFDLPSDGMAKSYIQDWKQRSGKPYGSSAPVVFQDADFESYVRGLLNKPAGVLTEADTARITNLEGEITDPQILLKFPNLRELWLFGQGLSDYSVLKELKYLKSFALDFNENTVPLDDGLLDVLEQTRFPYLTSLTLEGKGKIDIGKLISNLPQLKGISISTKDLGDVSELAKLSGLTYASLKGDHLTGLKGLLGSKSTLKQLDVTTFNNSGQPELAAELERVLPQLTSLDSLWLDKVHVKDISFVKPLTKLKTLQITYNDVEDISPVASLKNLDVLSVANNRVQDLTPVSELKNLSYLIVADNRINDLSTVDPANGFRLMRLKVKDNYLDLSEGSRNKQILDKYKEFRIEMDAYEEQKEPAFETVILKGVDKPFLTGAAAGIRIQPYALYTNGAQHALAASDVSVISRNPDIVEVQGEYLVGLKPGAAEIAVSYNGVYVPLQAVIAYPEAVLKKFADYMVVTVDNQAAIVNGRQVVSPAAPVIINETTLIPLRFVTENLGYDVKWDGALEQITIANGKKSIVFVLDKLTAQVDGQNVQMTEPVQLIGDSSYVPLRFLFEKLDKRVFYQDGHIIVSDAPVDGPALAKLLE